MSTPSPEITAYTPLETLLLFHNLSTHGTHPTSFSLISNILVRNPLVKNGETFDRGRLAPDALREFYLSQLSEAESELGNDDGQFNGDEDRPNSPVATRNRKAKTPPAVPSNSDKSPVVTLTSRLYEQYRSVMSRQIRDDEKRCSQLEQDIEDISAGLWDERLLNERATKARSRSSSAIPCDLKEGTASPSPSPEEQNIELDVEPIPEQDNKPRSSVSVEVSPRVLPTQHIPRTPTAPSRSPSQPLVLSCPIISPIKLEQPSPAPETPQKRILVSVSVPQPPPQTCNQPQEGLRETYKAAHPQTKREGIKVGLTQAAFDWPKPQTAKPRQSSSVQATPLSSSRKRRAQRALSAPIPSPQALPKTEAVPPPLPQSVSSPVAPPLSRPLGAKIEAPVPPPTRTLFPPITPRPLQPAYPPSQTPPPRQPPTTSASVQKQSPEHQGLSGLLQLADVADTRWQQQHTPSYATHGTPIHPQMSYSSPGQQTPYSPAPMTPTPQGRGTPAPSTPGGGNFGIPFSTPASTTPSPSVQQHPQYSPHSQARPIAIAQPAFQHYSPQAPVQQENFEQVPLASSPPVQRIAPRPPLPSLPLTVPVMSTTPLQQLRQVSPRRTRPPPINTEIVSPRTPPNPHSPAHREPGSPIPPRPDEISPISTPSRSPEPPESPKPNIEKARGKKRLFQEDEQSPGHQATGSGNKDIKQPGQSDRGREVRPAAKRQKSIKYDKAPSKKDVVRGSSSVEKKDVVKGNSNVEKKNAARCPNAEKKDVIKANSTVERRDVARRSSSVEKTPETLPVPENKVKDEETEAMDMQSPTSAAAPIEAEQEPMQKPKGRGRPPKKPKAKPEERGRETVPQPKEKRPKRKRAETIATPQFINDADSDIDTASVSPTPQRRHIPKLEPQNSNVAINIPSPSPRTITIGQHPLVVATKKFLGLTTPLMMDISSHKFANLFSAAVNERMAPGYRNLVFRPQDLKSIRAAVKSGIAAISNTSTGTPARTPTTEPFAAATPPASSSTFATFTATTLNTPPKGIVNSVQLEKEIFRMFANAIMYNKSTTEIAKETVMMARDIEGIVNNFRTAEEAGMKKALGTVATGIGFGSAKKLGVRDRERERDNTVETITREDEQSINGEKDDGDGEDSMMDTDEASERGKGKGGIGKRKRSKR